MVIVLETHLAKTAYYTACKSDCIQGIEPGLSITFIHAFSDEKMFREIYPDAGAWVNINGSLISQWNKSL